MEASKIGLWVSCASWLILAVILAWETFYLKSIMFPILQGRFGASQQGIFGYCGNAVADPLMPILNWGLPLALLSVIALFRFRRHTLAGTSGLILASLCFAVPAITLFIFAVWFFHGVLCLKLASHVWWVFGI